MKASRARKILFASYNGLAIDCAWQCQREGSEVLVAIEDKRDADIGDGLVPKIDNWRTHVAWADFVVFDDTLGHGVEAKRTRVLKPTIGGTPYTDRLEDDRGFGQSELARHGVAIAWNKEFTSFTKAVCQVRERRGRYVFKPNGTAANAKQLLYVGNDQDGNDMVDFLEAMGNSSAHGITSFQLQEYAAGVEVAVGAFFNGTQFLYPVNINFEHKRLFPYEIGPTTGEMGTSMRWVESSSLFDKTLGRFEATLRREGYVGYIDLNCIVREGSITPIEFTARFGYPTIQIQADTLSIPLNEFFYGLATGSLTRVPVIHEYAVGVRIVAPPYPFNDHELFQTCTRGGTIVGMSDDIKQIHLEDVRRENGVWRIAGWVGAVLIAVGTGPTCTAARTTAYKNVQRVYFPNRYYRHDIGEQWNETYSRLVSWGYVPTV